MASTETSDTQFFNLFSLVLGILIAVAIMLFVTARLIGAHTQGEYVESDPLRVHTLEQNIAPFSREAVAGQDNSALTAAAAPAAPAGGGSAAAVPTTGQAAFQAVCSACHGAGINGAPKAGDKAAWAARIAQGKDVLYQHAINGIRAMPARGGSTWPDATVRMAVDYMVSLVK
ncbi:c-type cytochrome [Bradyrhizobium sp.]|uniref:c-type cytochrome n=1 Tax=Bradyrhizobium sp. TaxID=376 RepID=UPI0026157809|nr:c-type cytochrome [Bradyrhizobium sp.]